MAAEVDSSEVDQAHVGGANLDTTDIDATITSLEVSAYTIPTEEPESDGTLKWQSTTLVLVEAEAGGCRGIGYSYADTATAALIRSTLAEIVIGSKAMDIPGLRSAMFHSLRNLGRPGICSMAVAAVDNALWDLKALLLGLPLVSLLGAVRDSVRVYGSGGFTSYSVNELQAQLSGWVEQGITAVKMKIGRDPAADLARVKAAREAIGAEAELFVDANAAYDRKQALAFAERFVEYDVSWFEEPVSSDDLNGLRLLRDRAPAGMDITAGEYGYDEIYFRRMLEAGAVDVLQADATRCGGISGFMAGGTLCDGFELPFSSHTAPSIHAHAGCAAPPLRHLEYFYDHARIERMLFDGTLVPVDGRLHPDLSRPGLGIEFKRSDAEQFAVQVP